MLDATAAAHALRSRHSRWVYVLPIIHLFVCAFIRRIRDAHTAVVGNRVRISLGGRSPVFHRGLYPGVATPDTRDDLGDKIWVNLLQTPALSNFLPQQKRIPCVFRFTDRESQVAGHKSRPTNYDPRRIPQYNPARAECRSLAAGRQSRFSSRWVCASSRSLSRSTLAGSFSTVAKPSCSSSA